jgi:hypothetical protein
VTEATSHILRVLSQDADTIVSPLGANSHAETTLLRYLLKVRADVDDKEHSKRHVRLTLRATHCAAPIAMASTRCEN